MRSLAGTRRICRQLSSGGGAAVLVADFQALDGAPRLSQLLSDEAAGQRIYQVDPLAALSGDRLYASLPELADGASAMFCSDDSRPLDGQRVFVVSYCSAAALSLQIATRLAGACEVTAILVQPTWPGSEHLTELLAEFQGKLGAGSRPCPDLDGNPWSCVARLEQFMSEELAGLATRLGFGRPPQAFSDLLLSYRAWLAFLLACRNDRPAEAPSDAVAVSVLTGEPDFILPGTAPGRCRITPPPAPQPDGVTPTLAKLVLD